ncbi:MAG: 4Fe-4S binding protein [Helicobacter sp.]|nr:4Fe-4S binding protein [Helicobacteraceae bacterium]MDY3113927.1 4Fe-4S binding protein [Helicobacter sp.]
MKQSRREFFLRFSRRKSGFLPLAPYNSNRSLFLEFCKTCKDKPCLESCTKALKKDSGILKFVENCVIVDFSECGCILCGECAKVCENGVLDSSLAESGKANWNFKLKILDSCLSYQKTMCFTCKDICASVLGRENAIKFYGMFYPEIMDNCINCGECVSVCPVKAITFAEVES